jgi:uncharacterized protein YecE (DUF72 family)
LIMAGKLNAGTSGYSYPEWRGTFYPEKGLPQSGFLAYYAERFPTVEINNTFYRFPKKPVLEEWASATPEGFTFAIKAHQGITHRAQLEAVGEQTRDFVTRCEALGAKLGPILFQLPPHLKRDDARLADFVELLPRGRFAVEFRDASWFEEPVMAILEGAGVALCVSEGESLDTPRHATAGFCYVRMRKDHYTDAELADWRAWIKTQTADGRDVFAYLKHDEQGTSPEDALRLLSGGRRR